MLKYSYMHRHEYEYVFWLDVDGKMAMLHSFRKLAQTLGLNVDAEHDAEKIVEWVRRWLERKKMWLLLLDNAEDMEDLFKYIPRVGGDIIMTTRNYISDEDAAVIHIDKMNVEDALLLIRGADSFPSMDSTEEQSAAKIVEELDYMPLAISLVRAYVKRTQTTYRDYLERYIRKREQHDQLDIVLAYPSDSIGQRYKHSMATVWQLSFEKIQQQNRLAYEILNACAFLQPHGIPVILFKRRFGDLLLPDAPDIGRTIR